MFDIWIVILPVEKLMKKNLLNSVWSAGVDFRHSGALTVVINYQYGVNMDCVFFVCVSHKIYSHVNQKGNTFTQNSSYPLVKQKKKITIHCKFNPLQTIRWFFFNFRLLFRIESIALWLNRK